MNNETREKLRLAAWIAADPCMATMKKPFAKITIDDRGRVCGSYAAGWNIAPDAPGYLPDLRDPTVANAVFDHVVSNSADNDLLSAVLFNMDWTSK